MVDQHLIKQLYKLIEKRLGLDVEMRTAIHLDEILRQLGKNDVAEFIQQLNTKPEFSPEWQQFIQALTLGETYFFRNQAQFALLKNHIIPQLVEQNKRTRNLFIWCAGCATGEEAYSIAILLKETIPTFDVWNITIFANDISDTAIETARRGIYRDWSFRHKNTHLMNKYFTETEQGYLLDEHIRQMVIFQQANLISMPTQMWAHLILCRNVILYFKDDAKKHAERVLHHALHPGGWLLLGHAEAIHYEREQWITHMFEGAIAYQKSMNSRMDPPGEKFYYSQSNPENSHFKVTTTLPSLSPENKGQDNSEAYRTAVRAFQSEEHERAESLLVNLLTNDPQNIKARLMLAAVFANRGANTEADAHLNTVLYQSPLEADAHYLRAMLHLEGGDTSKAEGSLKAALYSHTGHPLAAFTLGNLCAKTGDLKRAKNLWEQALQEAQKLAPRQPISDFNPRTAADFAAILQNQLRDA